MCGASLTKDISVKEQVVPKGTTISVTNDEPEAATDPKYDPKDTCGPNAYNTITFEKKWIVDKIVEILDNTANAEEYIVYPRNANKS